MASLPSTPVSESQRLLTELFDRLPQGVIAYEAIRDATGSISDYRTTYYNPHALSISGNTAEQMTLQSLFERAPYMRGKAEDLRRVVEEHIPYRTEELMPTNNRWFMFDNRPLTGGFFTTFQDIDDRKRAQQQTEDQKLLLQGIINATNDSITYCEAVRDSDGRIIDFVYRLTNSLVNKLIGLPAEQIIGQRMTTFFPSVKEVGLFQRYVAVVETGQTQSFEYPYQADGYNGWYLLSATPLLNGFVLSFKDISESKRAAQQIEDQARLFEGVLQTSENSIIVYEAVHGNTEDPLNFRIIHLNEASLKVAGRSREELMGRLLTEIYPDTKKYGLWHQYVEVYETGRSFQGNHYYPYVKKWFNITIAKLGDGLVATFNDITLAQYAARQIEEQARLFNSVLKSITNGLSVLEAVHNESGDIVDVRYVRVSQAILSDTGLTEEQLVGKSMLSLYPSVKETPYWSAYLAAFATGELQHFETHYHYDGFDNYTDNWVTRIDENRIISIYSIINNQKRVELQAKQQAAMLQSVLNSCQIPIVLFEAIRDENNQVIDFRYLLQNEANARVVGHPLDQTTTRTMLEVLPTLKTTGIFDHYVEVANTGQPQRFEQHLTDGIVAGWFDISVVRQGDGIVVSVNDQTLLRQTLQRTEQLVNDLKQSNQHLEQFAYVASHDLQEPLRKIQSFGDLLLNQHSQSLSEDGQDIIARMQSSAARMSLFIRDLLAYSRLATQQEPFQLVDLQTLLTDIQNDLSVVIAETQAVISIGSDSHPLPVVNGNLFQLRQLFQNLISNALKFARSGTAPQISVVSRFVDPESVPVNVPNRQHRSWVAIDVMDNGIGFDEKYQDRIFQLFERLHSRSAYSGTGIGLAICRKVAENHGGTILARGQPGAGATFTVFLPK